MHVSNIRADTVPCHLPACQARKNHDSATPCQPVLGRLAEGKTARTKKTRSPLLSNSPIGVGICAPVASQCMLILARTVMPFSGCRLLRAEYIGTGSELLKSRVSGTKNRINEYETLLSQNRSGSDAIHGQHGHQEQCLQSSSFWSGIAQRGLGECESGIKNWRSRSRSRVHPDATLVGLDGNPSRGLLPRTAVDPRTRP